MKKRNAFTLIELLVVISVIAVLMAILMPSLQRARKQARSVVCQSNLKQWGAVWAMYLSDNNYKFPIRYGNRGRWIDVLWNFYKSEDFRLCPSATKPTNPTGNVEDGDDWGSTFYAWGKLKPENNRPETTYGSYGLNEWVSTPGEDPLFGGPKSWYYKTSLAKLAHEIPLFADCYFFSVHPRNGDTLPDEDIEAIPFRIKYRSTTDSINRVFINRHQGTINMLLLDFTVENVRLKRLFGYRWHPEYMINRGVPRWPAWLADMPE